MIFNELWKKRSGKEVATDGMSEEQKTARGLRDRAECFKGLSTISRLLLRNGSKLTAITTALGVNPATSALFPIHHEG